MMLHFRRQGTLWLLLATLLGWVNPAHAVVLWSDLGATLVHDTGAVLRRAEVKTPTHQGMAVEAGVGQRQGQAPATQAGVDILGGALKRDDSASDTLYFKFHVDPLSDVGTEEYSAAFQLYEGDVERLAVGNSLKAWAYSAFNTSTNGEFNKVFGDMDLRSSQPESSSPGVFLPYELPRRGIERTIVFKVQYVPGGDDLVTVWLNPDLSPGATEAGQPESLTTTFRANASFNEIRLRHEGGGGGWTFSDMEIATAFSDFVSPGSAAPGGAASAGEGGGLPLTFRSWQREQGLPRSSVLALAQTRDGYLWIGSDDGVVRFDGVRFVSFGLREGLRSGPVQTLFEDSQGTLWIGAEDSGLTRWQDGQFTTFTTRDGLPADSITALGEDKEGRLWVGTQAGLAAWKDGHFDIPSAAEQFKGKTITTLCKDQQGVLWVGATGAGVFQWVDDKFVALTDAAVEGLLLDPHCLLEDKAGRIWVGAGDDFVLCRDGGQWRRYRIPRHLARPYVSALAEEPNGTVWAGSVSEGLFQFKEGKLAAINASRGLLDNSVESLLVDREGNLWVGTGAGLQRLRRSNLLVFGQNEGLGYGPVQGLAEVAPGVIWAGKPSDGLYRWEGRNFSRLSAEGLSRRYPEVISLLMGRDGNCWISGAQGLWRCSDPKDAVADVRMAALAGLNIIALAEDRDGAVWAGTREGQVWRGPSPRRSQDPNGPGHVGGSWSSPAGGTGSGPAGSQQGNWVAQTNYAQTRAITTILQDAEGGMWIGTDGRGLYRFKDGARTHFEKGAGLLSDWIRTLYLDAQGTVWIGTAGGGLSRWRGGPSPRRSEDPNGPGHVGGSWSSPAAETGSGHAGGQLASFTTREGLPDNTISQILEDDMGRLWLGSNRGIARVSKAELEDVAAGKVTLVYPQVYGRAEGMPSEECTGGFYPAGLKTRSGRLCFATLKGIVVADPRPQTAGAPAPTVVLEETLVDGVAANIRRPQAAGADGESGKQGGPPAEPELRIGPGKHRVEFHYTGMSFSSPERVRFRYRLEPLDTGWVEAGAGRSALYSYVPPGEYRFRVIACNSSGIWNETGASLSLIVMRHWWQGWWLFGLATLGLMGSVAGFVRIAEKRKHQRRFKLLEQERALEHERARIAQDLHDDLGSSLTRISLLSDLARADRDNPNQVEGHLQKISHSAGQTVRALEEIVWALRPGSDSLQSLVEYIAHVANEMFEGDTTRCRLDLPQDLPAQSLPPEMRHNIFLVVKEALTNALKHSHAREVRVRATASARVLEIVVQDDGQGFAEGALPPTRGKRHGLRNMRRRAEDMGGTLEVESGPGKGTTVKLTVRFPGRVAGG